MEGISKSPCLRECTLWRVGALDSANNEGASEGTARELAEERKTMERMMERPRERRMLERDRGRSRCAIMAVVRNEQLPRLLEPRDLDGCFDGWKG